MRPEDINQFFDAAFAKVQPKDEAERIKLEKLRSRLGEINEEFAAEMRKLQEEAESVKSSQGFGKAKAINRERTEMAKQLKNDLVAGFEEHCDLLKRIVSSSQAK